MLITRPMLAGRLRDYNVDLLRFPVLATPKLDGIRCLKLGGEAYARSFKPIRNQHIAHTIAQSSLPDGCDGELMAGETFQDVESAVMSADGTPDFTYWVFDVAQPEPYKDRVQYIPGNIPWVRAVLPVLLENATQFDEYYSQCLEQGFEGIMTRDPDGPYKCGRSTPKEQWLLKWKQFFDREAVIIGFEEARTNLNPQVPNNFGLMRRPGGSGGKVAKGTLGSLVCMDERFGRISCSGKMDDALKQHIWNNQSAYIGRTITYRYQAIGVKDKPRMPIFQRFRDDPDA